MTVAASYKQTRWPTCYVQVIALWWFKVTQIHGWSNLRICHGRQYVINFHSSNEFALQVIRRTDWSFQILRLLMRTISRAINLPSPWVHQVVSRSWSIYLYLENQENESTNLFVTRTAFLLLCGLCSAGHTHTAFPFAQISPLIANWQTTPLWATTIKTRRRLMISSCQPTPICRHGLSRLKKRRLSLSAGERKLSLDAMIWSKRTSNVLIATRIH